MKLETLVHDRTLFPRHQHLPAWSRVRVLPMCPEQNVTYLSERTHTTYLDVFEPSQRRLTTDSGGSGPRTYSERSVAMRSS